MPAHQQPWQQHAQNLAPYNGGVNAINGHVPPPPSSGSSNLDPYHQPQPPYHSAQAYHQPPISPDRAPPAGTQPPAAAASSTAASSHWQSQPPSNDLASRNGHQGPGYANTYDAQPPYPPSHHHHNHYNHSQPSHHPSARGGATAGGGGPHPTPSYAYQHDGFSVPASNQRPHDQYAPAPHELAPYYAAPTWVSNDAQPSVLQSPSSSSPGGVSNLGPRGLPSSSPGANVPGQAATGGSMRGYGGSTFEDADDLDDLDEEDRQRASGSRGAGGVNGNGSGSGAAQKSTSDFVKKLFAILGDPTYESIVTWSPSGESFLVKDINDFTKHVLPRNFRHSNFASFVRQLNKYDFHKVKNPDDPVAPAPGANVGEHQWEFQHPGFVRGREDLLENVKRKIPAKKKGGAAASGPTAAAVAGSSGGALGGANKGPAARLEGSAGNGLDMRDDSPALPQAGEAAEKAAESYSELKAQVASLNAVQDQMSSHINSLTKQYQGIIGEMLTYQKNMVQQDQLMQSLIQYLMNVKADKRSDSHLLFGGGGSDAFVASDEANRLIGNYEDVTQASFAAISEISQRVANNQPPGTSASVQSRGAGSKAGPGASAGRPPRGGDLHQSAASIATSGPLSPKSVSSPVNSATGPASGSTTAAARATAPSQDVKAKGSARESGNGAAGGAGNGPTFHPPHQHAESDASAAGNPIDAAAGSLSNPNAAQFGRAGLRVYTVGTLQPREGNKDYLANNAADPTSKAAHSHTAEAVGAAFRKQASPNGSGSSSGGAGDSFGFRVPQLEDQPRNMPRVDGRSSSNSGSPNPYGSSVAAAAAAGATATAASGSDSKTPESDAAGGSNRETSTTPSDVGSGGRGNYLRVRRSTFVPGWAIPPRVLLVDDDAVCRKLSSKFLQVFGCSIDYAVDGMSAVNKMNLEKYDLVLMDIVMPNLDGVSATSLIRQFDPRTPIISMTSNSGPSELMQYMANGMDDMLPKPFTKEGLLNMLEKHLIHLKTVQKMEDISRSRGHGSVMESALQSALSTSHRLSDTGLSSLSSNGGPSPLTPTGDASTTSDSTLNPLAGMGFSDEEYIAMLQNLIAAGSFSDSSGNLTNPAAQLVETLPGEGVGSSGSGSGSDSTTTSAAATAGVMMEVKEEAKGKVTGGVKRSAETNADERTKKSGKRGRFTEIR